MPSITQFCKHCEKNHRTHEYQDAHYGLYIRVMNHTVKNSTKDVNVHRCTVCGNLNNGGIDKK